MQKKAYFIAKEQNNEGELIQNQQHDRLLI